jgi:hypothetical protein
VYDFVTLMMTSLVFRVVIDIPQRLLTICSLVFCFFHS